MAAEAKTRRQTPEPDEDSVDRAAHDLAEILDANSTGEWEAIRASLHEPEERPR